MAGMLGKAGSYVFARKASKEFDDFSSDVSQEDPEGQTMAYGVPAVVHALKKRKSYVRKRPSPTCLVLAPSSEVVQQITNFLDGSLGSLRVKIGSSSGDLVNNPKNNTLKPGVSIAITTPDSLLKMLEDGSCSLDLVSFFVLDGADSMLHSGYETVVRDILDQAPAKSSKAANKLEKEPKMR